MKKKEKIQTKKIIPRGFGRNIERETMTMAATDQTITGAERERLCTLTDNDKRSMVEVLGWRRPLPWALAVVGVVVVAEVLADDEHIEILGAAVSASSWREKVSSFNLLRLLFSLICSVSIVSILGDV